MKNSLPVITLVFVFGLISNAQADGRDAVIRYSNNGASSESRPYKMVIKNDNRVSGKIDDIATLGSGEDESDANACFEGKIKDVCDLLEVATKELSDKKNEKYRLECKPGGRNKKIIEWSVKNNRSRHDDRRDSFGGWIYPCDDKF